MKKFLSIALIIAGLKLNAQLNFSEPDVYGKATNPLGVTVADFNKDGFQDIASANNSTDDITIFYGNGTGKFGTAIGNNKYKNFPAGTAPLCIASADFDKDGNIDIAVANSESNDISILYNDGEGNFLLPVNYSVGQKPVSMVVGDFNNDQFPDIAVSNNQSASISVLLNNSNGTLLSAIEYQVEEEPKLIKLADFNNDDILDIAIICHYTLYTLKGLGEGLFDQLVNIGITTPVNGFDIGDFNHDGNNDFITSGYEQILFYTGNGNCTFNAPQLVYYAQNTDFLTILAGDFIFDNSLDFIVQIYDFFLLFNGDTNGNFSYSYDYPINNSSAGFYISNSVIADVNNDDLPDIINALDFPNQISVLLADKGSGGFCKPFCFGKNSLPTYLTHADFNNDGFIDLIVVYGGSNESAIFLNNGNGKFEEWKNKTSVSDNPNCVTVHDFDNDGYYDIVTTNTELDSIFIFTGDGQGNLNKYQSYYFDRHQFFVVTEDFNGDLIYDLAITNWGNNEGINIFNGNLNGSFSPGSTLILNGTMNIPEKIIFEDFNGDNIKDFLVNNFNSCNISFFLGLGNGNYGAPKTNNVIPNPHDIKSDDFNNDGKRDIIVAKGGSLSIMIGKGNGTFEPEINISNFFFLFYNITVADFNHDENLDIMASGGTDDNLYFFLGKGDGTFHTPISIYSGSFPVSSTSADFNGDGKTDLAVINRNSHNLVVFTNTTNIGVSENNLNNPAINISPNPATDQIIIDNPEQEKLELEIFHSDGRLMYRSEINNGNSQIDIKSFSSGIYLLHLKNNNKHISRRIIKL